MAEVVGDYDDDPVPPRPGRSENYSPFVDDEQDNQPQQEEQHENENEQQRLSRTETNISTSSRPREATELDEIRRLSTASTSEGSLSSGEYRVPSRHSGATTTTTTADTQERRNRQKKTKWVPESVRRFWARNITLEVPQKGNRDYFGTTITTIFPFFLIEYRVC